MANLNAKLIPVLAIAVSLVGPVSADTVTIGDAPPDALGKTIDGEPFLVSEGVGRVQIITFWATWCPPCLKELPVLDAIQKQGGADRIRVVAVNLKESREQFRKAMHAFREFEIDFIHDRNGKVAKRYGVGPIPHMLMIDPDGKVASQHTGYSEAALGGIVDEINLLLRDVTPGLADTGQPSGNADAP